MKQKLVLSFFLIIALSAGSTRTWAQTRHEVNNEAELNAALEDVKANGGTQVITLMSDITLTANLTEVCNSMTPTFDLTINSKDGEQYKIDGAGKYILITADMSTYMEGRTYKLGLQNLTLTGGNNPDADPAALYASNLNQLTLTNVVASENITSAIHAQMCDNTSFNNVMVVNNGSDEAFCNVVGIHMESCDFTMENVTIANNKNIIYAGLVIQSGNCTMRNCIIWGNSGMIDDNDLVNNAYTSQAENCYIESITGEWTSSSNIFDTDPELNPITFEPTAEGTEGIGSRGMIEEVTVVTPDNVGLGGTLYEVTNLRLDGSWDSSSIQKLATALHYQGVFERENPNLQKVTCTASATFTGTSLSLSYLFSFCSALTSVQLPAYSLATVDLEYAFQKCPALKRINSDTDGVFDLTSFSQGINKLNYTFYICAETASIKLPAYSGGIVDFTYAFYGCESLEFLNGGDSGIFDLSPLSAGISSLQGTFSNCLKAVSIIIPDYTGDVNFGNAFYGCTQLSRVNVGTDTNVDGVFNLIPSSAEGVNASIPATFMNCPKVVSIKVPGNSNSVTSLAGTFGGCTSLKQVNSDADGVFDLTAFSAGINASLYNSFKNCQNAVSIKLPDTNTGTYSFHLRDAFSGCTSLKRINSETDGVFDISFLKGKIGTGVNSGLWNTFLNCPNAVTIKLPDYIASGTTGAIRFSSAFEGCNSLQTIEKLDTYTSINRIDNAFTRCYSLSFVKLASVPSSYLSGTFDDTNTNCLKYLPAETVIPTDWEGYSNFIVGNQSEGSITLSDRIDGTAPGTSGFNPFYCPTEFTIAPGCSITYTRPAENLRYATAKNGWNTLVLPFDATLLIDGTEKTPVTKLAKGSYWLCPFVSATEEGEVNFEDTEDGMIHANVPYLFTLPGNTYDGEHSMEGKDAVFTSAVSDGGNPITVKASADVDYSGHTNFSYQGVFIPQVAKPMYLLTPGEGEDGDSFMLYDKGNAASFRAYFAEVGKPSGIRQLTLGNAGGGTTGLTPLVHDAQTDESAKPRKVMTRQGLRIIKDGFVYNTDGALIGVVETE